MPGSEPAAFTVGEIISMMENTYWHVNIKNIDGRWEILTIKGNDNFILDDYQIVE